MTSNASSSSSSDSTTSESPHNTELDKTLMAELRANYYVLCAQEDEFLKVMQNRKLCQLSSHNPSKRSDLALLNMCISILEIRQLQGTGTCYITPPNGCNSACTLTSQRYGQMPVSDQLQTIRKNKEKLQRTLKNLEGSSEIDEELQNKMLAEMTADYYMLKAQENECAKETKKERYKTEYLKKLRDEKRRVILVLRSLRDNIAEEEEVDKTVIAEMLAKYDMLSFQEEELCRLEREIEPDNYQMLSNSLRGNVNEKSKTNDRQKVT